MTLLEQLPSLARLMEGNGVACDRVVRMTAPPDSSHTLSELRAIADPQARIQAADTIIAASEERIREVRRLRDDALGELSDQHGPAAAARLSGHSLSTVKIARRRR